MVKLDVLIIRIAFAALLAAMGFLLNPLAQTTHFDASRPMRQVLSAVLGAVIAAFTAMAPGVLPFRAMCHS